MNWYTITMLADDEAEVRIDDAIGGWFGADPKDLLDTISGLNASRIHLRLNSPGGEVFAGTAIYNALKDHPAQVTVHIDGLAASVASIIAMAGDEIRMAENAYLMVHNPAVGIFGQAGDLRQAADVLDKIRGVGAKVYADRSGGTVEQFLAAMDAETWYTADEAKAAGLIDAIDANKQGSATAIQPANIVKQYRERFAAAASLVKPNVTPAANVASTGKNTTATQEHLMTLEQFKEFAAAHPEAVKEYEQAGYTKATAELTPKAATLEELETAFAGEDKFILEQMKAKATMSAAHVAFAAILKTRLDAANQKVARFAPGGQAPVPDNRAEGNVESPDKVSPARRRELLSKTPAGMAILRREDAAAK